MDRVTALHRHVGNVRRDNRGRYIPRDAWVRADGNWIIPRYWEQGSEEEPSWSDEAARLKERARQTARRAWTWLVNLGEPVTEVKANRHADYVRMRAQCDRFWDDIGGEG